MSKLLRIVTNFRSAKVPNAASVEADKYLAVVQLYMICLDFS